MSAKTLAALLAILAGSRGLGFAQSHQHSAADNHRERYAIQAVRVDQPPKIDGVLDDEVWKKAPLVEEFTQQEPREGAAASERTEVRVLYDGKTLHIGVHAFDLQPSSIVATEMRRDSDRLLDEDNFQIILDTFNDSRNGYMFVTTPLGAKLEQQISEEGEGNNRIGFGLVNSNINKNWDGIWEVAARITDDGWTAEIAIPLATLRFADGAEQTWGINFMRNIRRKNEQVFWAPIPKAYTLTRVSQAGSLVGLQSLNHGLDLKLKPYVVSGVRDTNTSASLQTTSFLRDVGFDMKYGVTGGMNADVTYNTDFAQVEVDEQQVNLTRFSLFFPEKRDFFLENAGQFKMGTGGTFTSTTVETDLFFSRRIGLSDTGTPIPIVGGGRLAGKAGRHNIGVLDIQTDSAFGRPGDNFLVARYGSDVLKRSRVGALFINKETMGGDARYNRVMGADANLVLGKNLQVNSFVAKTDTPGLSGRDMAFFGRIAYRDPAWNVWLNYLDVQDNFNDEVGFVQRRGVKTTKVYFSPTPRPGKWGIRMLEPMVVISYITDQQNRMVGRTQHFMNGFYMQDGSFINVIYQRDLDVLDVPFVVPQTNVTIPVGSYKFDEATFSYNTNPAKRFYERFSWNPMQFYDGTKQAVTAAIGVRATKSLSSELNFSRNDVKMPWGDFVSNLAILRVDYALSPRATVRSLTQYNSLTHEVTNNLRFNFIYRPGSDIYIVYSDLQQTGLPQAVFAPSDRQLVVKMNYLLTR
ncbi:MAG TPA: DUF5916 domain-containing protein [Vicinamibacterales bacterium]|nr:DUF5916 domain-containing protein [Vicinamibacterales bacterium]